jgi:hypothetical protein
MDAQVDEQGDEAEDGVGEPLIGGRYPARSNRRQTRVMRELASGDALRVPPPHAYLTETSTFFPEMSMNPTYRQTLTGPESGHWQGARQRELDAHVKNNTYTVIEDVDEATGLPRDAGAGATLVRSLWVNTKKLDQHGETKLYKSRLVATETKHSTAHIDKSDATSPVVTKEGLRTAFALAAAKGMEVYQLDVSTAYVNAELDREVYLTVPEGMDNVKPGSVLRLNKCLYGLRTSGNRWNKLFNSDIEGLGYKRTKTDPCLYVREESGVTSYIALVVDDMMIATTSVYEYKRVLRELNTKYSMKDEGKMEFFVGIQVQQREDGIFIHQQKYAEEVLRRFGMDDCKPADTPGVPKQQFSSEQSPRSEEEVKVMSRVPYREAVGALMHLAVTTRPDISEAVSSMSQFASDPGQEHWMGVKRIMRYVKGSTGKGLFYGRCDGATVLEAYSDANYAECVDTRRSVSGAVGILNGPIFWVSKKQRCVTLSTMEAEYVGLCVTATNVIWTKHLLEELGIDNGAVQIWGDNAAANLMANKDGITRKAKHIEVQYHFTKDCVQNKLVLVNYVASKDNLADIFTKPLSKEPFRYLRDSLVTEPRE